MKKNAQITYKISSENNKISLDNILLDFCEINDCNEKRNIFCSREKAIPDSSGGKLLFEKMEAQKPCIEFNHFPTPIYDCNNGDDDDD